MNIGEFLGTLAGTAIMLSIVALSISIFIWSFKLLGGLLGI